MNEVELELLDQSQLDQSSLQQTLQTIYQRKIDFGRFVFSVEPTRILDARRRHC